MKRFCKIFAAVFCFTLLSLTMNGVNCTVTDSVSGYDSNPTTATVDPNSCTGGGMITAIAVTSSTSMENEYCGSWYSFRLEVVHAGGTVSNANMCQSDFSSNIDLATRFPAITDIASVTAVRLVSVDDDNYADQVFVNLELDVTFTPVACPSPSALTVANITASSADLSWTDNAGATQWDVEYGTTGFAQGTGTMVTGTTTNPHTLTGLTSSTSYDFYVRTDCGGGDYSSWVGPFNFTTICPAYTIPYQEDFNTWVAACWENDATVTRTWAKDGNNGWVYADFWNWNNGSAHMISPEIDITSDARLKFNWSHSYEAVYPNDQLQVQLSVNGGAYTDIFNASGAALNSQDGAGNTTPGSFVTETINLDPAIYTGKTIRARVIATSGFGPRLYFDEFIVEEMSPCPSPSALTVANTTASSADLSWTDNAGATQWDVEYGTTGFAQGTGTMVTGTTTNPHTLTGLTDNTSYDFYVKADCGASGVSLWRGPYSFTTRCLPLTNFPYIEDFENGGNMPSCWDQEFAFGSVNWSFTGSNHNGSVSAQSGSYLALLRSTSSGDTRLITPSMDLTGLTNGARLVFSHSQAEWGYDQDELKVYYKTSNSGSWTLLETYTTNIPAWQTDTIILPNASADYYIAFEGISAYGYGVTLDDVIVEAIPLSCSPVDVVVNTTNHGNEISWQILDANSTIVSSGYGYGDHTTYSTVACLIPGQTYTFESIDVYGDGWNGGTYEVSLCNGGIIFANNGGNTPNNNQNSGGVIEVETSESFTFITPSTDDVSVAAITSPVSNCGLSSAEAVSIQIQNIGNNDLTAVNIPIEYNLNGGGWLNGGSFSGTIAKCDVVTFTLSSTIDLSTVGDYTLQVRTAYATDGNTANDEFSKDIVSVPTISTLPYTEGFEIWGGGWTTGLIIGSSNTWEHGTPAGTSIAAAAEGTQAWVTNLTGDFQNDEETYLMSPCLDLSSTSVDPAMSFQYIFYGGDSNDLVDIQVSTDGGATWGGSISSYALSQTSWTSEMVTLTGLAGQANARVRLRFKSNNNTTGEGFGFDQVEIFTPGNTWLGLTTDWHVSTNWESGSVPLSTTDVIIPSSPTGGNMPQISTAVECNNLNIGAGAGIISTVSGGLSISGNITNNGTMMLADGSVNFVGTTAQSITGSCGFHDVTINNAAGVTSNGAQTLSGYMTFINGNFNTNGRDFILTSDMNKTGSLGEMIIGTSEFIGDLTIQRYIPTTAWHIFGSSVSGTLSGYMDDILTTGFPGSTYPNYPWTNVYFYDETVIGSNGMNSGFSAPSGSSDVIDDKGIWFYVNSGITVDLTGIPNKGSHNIPVFFTSSGNTGDDGWNYVANPYPCTIDWHATNGWTKTNIDAAVYQYDASVAGGWTYTVGGITIPAGETPNIIASLQGFLVKASGTGTPALSVTEQAKVNNDVSFKNQPVEIGSVFTIDLNGEGHFAQAAIRVHESATEGFDQELDAFLAPMNSQMMDITISSIANDGEKLVINSLAELTDGMIIPIEIKTPETGTYAISLNDPKGILSAYNVSLEDTRAGRVTEEGTMTITTNENELVIINLRLGNIATNADNALSGVTFLQNNDIINVDFDLSEQSKAVIEVLNLNGQAVIDSRSIDAQITRESINLSNQANGIYFVRVTVGEETKTQHFSIVR